MRSPGAGSAWVAVAVAVLAAAILPACARSVRPAAGRTVDITERDFHISGPSSIPSGGLIDVHIHNNGPSTHELVIVRTDLAAPNLPLQLDGLTIDEESPLLHAVNEDGNVPLGTTTDLLVHLAPGHYVLFCNLEGHYLGGMHLSLEVGDGAGY